MTRTTAPGGNTSPQTAGAAASPDETFWDALARADARHARRGFLRTRSAYAALMLATDITACQALLYGRPVPQHRLDPELVQALDLEPGAPVGLTANLVEQVLLYTPLAAREAERKAA